MYTNLLAQHCVRRMNWVHFVEIEQPVSTSEQNRLVDDWFDRRPVKPAVSRPLIKFIFSPSSRDNDWHEYEQAMIAWRLEVRTFFKWWPTNEYVSEVLQKSAKDTHVL